MKKLLLSILLMLLPILASADPVEINGLWYNLVPKTKEAEVTRYTTYYSGKVDIPASVMHEGKTYSVTSIGKRAFADCRDLTSVTIPNSVTSIGEEAFAYCSRLTSITIPNSVTSIGEEAFLYCWELTSVTIPNSVTSIGGHAFDHCQALTSVTIGNSVTTIGEFAFSVCGKLTSIIIPNSVTSIGRDAFNGCSGLTSVTIPNSVNSIGQGVFAGCSGLTSIIIPNSVTSIGLGAFSGCSGLTSITIPNNVTSIGGSAFCGCSGLTSIIIPNSVTSIGDNTFRECSGLTSVTIPNSVTSIGDYAFEHCSALTSVTIPNSVTSVGDHAFEHCSALTFVTIPNSVTSIGFSAFANCKELYDVICLAEKLRTKSWSGDGLYTYDNAFEGSYIDYATLHVPASAIEAYRATVPWNGFKNIVPIEGGENPNEETNGTCGEGVNYSYDKATHTLTISGSGEMADYEYGQNEAPWFSYADEIQKIEIESGITSIGHFAFYQCSSVTSLSIPATVGYIGSSAFEDCTSLTSLTLNEGLLSIGGSAFENCTGLQTLSIPSTVNAISINAFKNCTGITDVYCYAETVPETHSDAFDATPTEKSTLHVPASAIEAYKATAPWSSFKSIVPIGEDDPSLTPDEENGSCGEGVNYSYDKATHTLTIFGIGEMADYEYGQNEAPWFSYADEIQKIEIESGITSIGNFAFYQCSNVTSLSIPATVGYIGSSAFEDCTSLPSLTLNEGLLSIGGSAFENCTGLQTLSIPSTVNAISINAFKNCTGITDVYCYAETVPDTHFDAFDATPTEKSTLHVPSNAVEAYRASWPWSDFKEIVPLNEDPDGITGIKQSDDVKTVYSIKGEKLLYPAHGINIIKMKDGTIKKVFVKY